MTTDINTENIEEVIKKVTGIDYKNNPQQALIQLATYTSLLKQKIRAYRGLVAAEKEFESVSWCINEIFNFKNQVYDSYHESNFHSHQKRIIETGHQIIKVMDELNKNTRGSSEDSNKTMP